MSQLTVPRWATSLADICLLLLGFFVILYTGKADMHEVARSTRGAFGSDEGEGEALIVEAQADEIFEEGEARLTGEGKTRLLVLGRKAAAQNSRVHVESVGRPADAARFDGWELSAARAAAVARTVEAGGVPSHRIELSIPPDRRTPPPPPRQQITVTTR